MNDNSVAALCAALAAVALITAPVACSIHDNYAVTEMVRVGAHPMDARCAVRSEGMSPMCVLRAGGAGVEGGAK